MSFTCPNCGFTEDVPKWVIDEQIDMAVFSGHDIKTFIPTSNCMECPTDMIPTDKLNK